MKINMTKREFARKAGTACAYTGIIATCFVAGYLIGMFILWCLTSLFGVKAGMFIYTILWFASCVWLFMTVFPKDKYGYRA